jgi:hypothetical protein
MSTENNSFASKTHIRLRQPPLNGPVAVLQRTLEKLGFHPQKIAGVDGCVIDLDDELLEGALAQVLSADARFVFYLDFKEKAPEAARNAVAEYITRANYGLIIGNFELDYDDGTIRFKTSLDFDGDELTEALIQNSVHAAREGITIYGKELIAVMRLSKSPADAISAADAAAAH